MRLAVLILAAGASTRFGGCKLLADVGGRPLLQNSIDLASSVAPDDVHVVSGAWHQALLDATSAGELTGARLVYSERWREGLSASLEAGIRHLETDYEAVLVLLADQVALTRDDLTTLLDAFDGGGICCGFYRGRRGVPAIFPRAVFPGLKALQGDQGAKQLLYDNLLPVRECPMPNAAMDIDTPDQLARWRS